MNIVDTDLDIHANLKDYGYLRVNDILKLVPVSRSTWYEWVRRGIAPKSISVSMNISAWKYREIKKLLVEIEQPDWAGKVEKAMSINV